MHVKFGIERFCEVERFFASQAFLLQNGRTTNYQIDHHSNEQKSPSSRNLLYKGFSRFSVSGLGLRLRVGGLGLRGYGLEFSLGFRPQNYMRGLGSQPTGHGGPIYQVFDQIPEVRACCFPRAPVT